MRALALIAAAALAVLTCSPAATQQPASLVPTAPAPTVAPAPAPPACRQSVQYSPHLQTHHGLHRGISALVGDCHDPLQCPRG